MSEFATQLETAPLQKPLICFSNQEGHNVSPDYKQEVLKGKWVKANIKQWTSEQAFQITRGRWRGRQIWYHHDPLRINQAIALYPNDFFDFNIKAEVMRISTHKGNFLFSFSLKSLWPCSPNMKNPVAEIYRGTANIIKP